MSTATLSMAAYTGEDEVLHYRAIHIGAVLGIALAVLLLAFTLVAATTSPEACIGVSFLNLAPLVCCVWALSRIRREPERYSGQGMARIGLALSLVLLVGGVSYGGYVYATEVPDGYARISFGTMKPDELQERGGLAVPPDISSLEGKNVFIKGYIRPDSITVPRGIDQFLLVRDNNQCCFGDMSKIKYYDQILVKMTGDHRVDFSRGVFNIGGVLHIEPQYAMPGAPRTVFTLIADYAK
jgi:predicted membrane channel-forming protein YqfA (hemolysin III family)